jgi:hypothetical protein
MSGYPRMMDQAGKVLLYPLLHGEKKKKAGLHVSLTPFTTFMKPMSIATQIQDISCTNRSMSYCD